MMALGIINIELMKMDLIKMVIIYMDLIKMDLIKMDLMKMDLMKMDLIKMDLINMVIKKASGRIKTNEAKSFKNQKGKGYINLPILLSKMYTNNSSKELKNNIKQLIKYLYDKKQITKIVYNNLNKAI